MPANSSDYVILPHSIYRKNENGRIEEKVEFPEVTPGVYDLCNVYSSDDAGLVEATDRLLNMAARQIREQGGQITSSDPYIARWIEQHRIP